MNRCHLVAAACVWGVVLAATPVLAQGQSQAAHGNSNNAKSKSGGSDRRTPNETALLPSTGIAGPAAATPFAWVDNATVMVPGTVWIGMSMVRWAGDGLTEVSAPVIDGAVGVSSRVQFGMSMPRVLGSSDPAGPQGGWGTTFANVKLGLLQDGRHRFNVAAAPTVEILSEAALAVAPTAQSRAQWGIPVSADLERGSARVYGSTGYFSPGVWFAGAGVGTQVKERIGLSISLSRAWSTSVLTDLSLTSPRRTELSGSGSFDLSPHLGVFGSIGQTIATSPDNGAGRTFSLGVSITATSAFHR